MAKDDDRISHLEEREALGIRPGGFGLMITTKMVDEVHYNEFGNEVILVKHLDPTAMTLDGKAALITGGKRIGAVVATTLAKAGADVALVYNQSRAEAEATVAEVQALGRRAVSVQADVTSEHDCARAVETTVERLGRLDILVNMASLYGAKPFDQLTAVDWDRQMSVDLRATFLFSRASALVMKRVGGGRIINFADWVVASGRPRYPGYLPYYVAKAGVRR